MNFAHLLMRSRFNRNRELAGGIGAPHTHRGDEDFATRRETNGDTLVFNGDDDDRAAAIAHCTVTI